MSLNARTPEGKSMSFLILLPILILLKIEQVLRLRIAKRRFAR
jgi:hypothetical protein